MEAPRYGGPSPIPRLVLVSIEDEDKPPLPQPSPRFALSAPTENDRQTAITRVWNPGDIARCRLCPAEECTGHDVACLVMAPGLVRPEDAALYSTVGLRWDGRTDR